MGDPPPSYYVAGGQRFLLDPGQLAEEPLPPCEQSGCEKPLKAQGMCVAHYQRARRAGMLGLSKEDARRKQLDVNLWSHHRIRLADYEWLLWVEQQGRCVICKVEAPAPYEDTKQWPVDHDHRCCPSQGKSCGKCRRGVLCSGCNINLKTKWEDVVWAQAALKYLGYEATLEPLLPSIWG